MLRMLRLRRSMDFYREIQSRKRGAFSGTLREALYAFYWLHRGQQIRFKEDEHAGDQESSAFR